MDLFAELLRTFRIHHICKINWETAREQSVNEVAAGGARDAARVVIFIR